MRYCKVASEGKFTDMPIAGIHPNRPKEFRLAIDSLSSNMSIQILDSKSVAGFEHVMTAALLTVKSWSEGRNLAHSPSTEVLLYSSAKRQIKEAISSMGVSEGSEGWVILALSDSQQKLESFAATLGQYGRDDDELVELTEGKFEGIMEKFKITEEELQISEPLVGSKTSALKSLVMERAALSELYR